MACRALFGVQFTGLPLENHGHLIAYHACCLLHAIYQFDDILKRSLSSWTGFQATWEHASKHSHVRTAHMLAILLHRRLYQFCVGKVLAGTVDALKLFGLPETLTPGPEISMSHSLQLYRKPNFLPSGDNFMDLGR